MSKNTYLLLNKILRVKNNSKADLFMQLANRFILPVQPGCLKIFCFLYLEIAFCLSHLIHCFLIE